MRHTTKNHANETLTYHAWLRLSEDGTMSLTRTPPSLASDERRMKIDIQVPTSIFKTPELAAKIEFDGEPIHINVAELSRNVGDTLEAAGFKVFVEPVEVEG